LTSSKRRKISSSTFFIFNESFSDVFEKNSTPKISLLLAEDLQKKPKLQNEMGLIKQL